MEHIDFTTITACGECCIGCKKKKMDYAKDVLKLTDIARNGHNQVNVQYISVQENIKFNFANCAPILHVMN